MKTSKTTVAGIALTGTAALLAAGAAPLMVLAATDAAPQAPEAVAATQEMQAATVSNQVQLSTVEGTFGFNQSTVTPNAQIKHDFQGADKYLCGTQAGTDLASKPLDEWTLTVGGDVDNAFTATLDELADDSALTVQMGCACAGNGADMRAAANAQVTGVKFVDIMNQAGVAADANTVTFTTTDGYKVSLPLSYVKQRYTLVVFGVNGEPLENSMGGTCQLWLGSTSAKYFARDIVAIDFTHEVTPPAAPGAADAANTPNIGVTASATA